MFQSDLPTTAMIGKSLRARGWSRARPRRRRYIQVQDYLIHLDQVVRVKTPAVDDVAIGRDEIRRDQKPAIRHDRAVRFQKRDEIAGFPAGSEANESALTTRTDHNRAVIAHVQGGETSLAEDRADANLRLPDPSVFAKGVTSADNRVAVRADGVRLAIESAVAREQGLFNVLPPFRGGPFAGWLILPADDDASVGIDGVGSRIGGPA